MFEFFTIQVHFEACQPHHVERVEITEYPVVIWCLFLFFQFDFKINLKELKDFLYTIQLYVEIPDYYAGTRMCNSVRLIIHEQGPKVDWEVVHETSQNYHSVLEFLLLPTGFFNYLNTITLNCFITTPISIHFSHLFFV